MTALLHPGVYVREVPSGVRTIEAVPTSTTIFVGETERGPLRPTKVRGVSEYERLFGGYLRVDASASTPIVRVTTRYAMDAFFRNGGGTAYILRAADSASVAATRDYEDGATVISADLVAAASPGAWGNDLYVVFTASSDGDANRFRMVVFARDLDSGDTNFVEDWDRLSLDAGDESYVLDVVARSSYIRWLGSPDFSLASFIDEAAAAGQSGNPANWSLAGLSATQLSSGSGGDSAFTPASLASLLSELDGVDDAALVVATPDAWVQGGDGFAQWYDALRTYVDNRPKLDLFFIGDLPRQDLAANATGAASAIQSLVSGGGFTRSDMTGVYWPHLEVADPIGAGSSATITVPPASAVAGLFARTDSRRGVWKAPAGTEATVGGLVGVEWEILDRQQADLNPQGVNAIRLIPGAGTVIWGARTLRPSSEWRYVPVRRTAMFLRKSIYNGIQWAVFEPNDEELWASLRATIAAFMETQFRNGAFAGTSSREAYFVKVDAETTTEIEQAAGVVNVLVGFAPLRPAEFVVVQLSQKTASAT